MGLGGSIFFLVFGALLVFAVTDKAKQDVEWLDLSATGWIFMIAGIIGIALTSWYAQHKKQLRKEVHESYQTARLARRDAIKRADAANNPVRQKRRDPMADERQAAD
ncbi:DUF6458 family protein [Stackebrandtia soli]|uniref:DUF6458 family protein n=1 Tax=Stackebrandtia soli TaxID=1892856 RepID=UPI0039EBA55E